MVGWESQATTIADPAEKERTVRDAVAALTASARACTAAGHGVAVVSCGGTGTFPYCAQQPGVTEVQVGGAIFSDMHYLHELPRRFCAGAHRADDGDEPADADAHRRRRRQEVDERRCGDAGASRHPADKRNEAVGRAHEDRTASNRALRLKIGDKIELIVGYSDTTVHLHEEIVGIRGGRIESIWRVAARGKVK